MDSVKCKSIFIFLLLSALVFLCCFIVPVSADMADFLNNDDAFFDDKYPTANYEDIRLYLKDYSSQNARSGVKQDLSALIGTTVTEALFYMYYYDDPQANPSGYDVDITITSELYIG